MKFDSLAMIETNGLVSALVAVNKMLSLGNVKFLKKEVISNGQVTLFVIGNSSEIKRILNAGTIAAQKVGVVISSGIVPYPNDVVEKIFFESSKSANRPKRVKKSVEKDVKVETLFDQIDDEASYVNLLAKVGDNKPDIAGEVLSFEEQKHSNDLVDIKTSKLEDDSEEKIEIVSIPSESSDKVIEEENISDDSKTEIEDSTDYNNSGIIDSEEDSNSEIENSEIEKLDNIMEVAQENSDNVVETTQENIEETNETNLSFEGISHIERLRAEAKSEIEKDTDNETKDVTEDEINSQINLDKNIELPENKSSNVNYDTEDNVVSDLEKMNVPELRKLARSKEDFPIKGREISKANRNVLLGYFNQLQ
ncbi:MAG: BMC domain-containing protein [Bacteroidales bacterium]|nr:BMC domain-containing protein [Bacteroidales bacterium]